MLLRAGHVGRYRDVGPLRRSLQAALDDDVGLFVALQIVLVPACSGRRESHGGRGRVGETRRPAAVRRLARASGDPAAPDHVVALVDGLDRHDQVVAVGDHHIRHLIQGLPRHLDAVHLQHLIVDRQQPGALRQASWHQPGNEDARDLLQPVRRHPHAGPVSDVEPERLVGAVAVQPDAAVRLGQDVHVDDGGDGPEVLGHADADVRPLAVDVIVAQRDHRLLLPG